jgi:ribonuclease HI
VIFAPTSKEVIVERGEYLGPATTNNEAEYNGLLIGLEAAKEQGIKSLVVEGDSRLVIEQVLGNWKVRDAGLAVLHKKVMKLIREDFDKVVIRHVPREENKAADELTNELARDKESFFRVYV